MNIYQSKQCKKANKNMKNKNLTSYTIFETNNESLVELYEDSDETGSTALIENMCVERKRNLI